MFSCIRTEYGNLREYFWSVFSPNTGKYGPEITVYLDTFHAVLLSRDLIFSVNVAHAKYVEEEREKKEKNGERKEIQTHKLEELDMQLSLHETNLQVAEEAIAEGNIKLKEALKDKKLSREKS